MSFNLADIVNPQIAPACKQLYALLAAGTIKIQPQSIEVYGTRILFKGNPVPATAISGQAIVLTWPEGASIDVSALPKRMDPSVRRVEIHADRIVVVTGYGSVTLRS